MSEDERWLPVPDFERFYEVSDHGRVRSVPRYKCSGRILKPRPLPKTGYMQLSFSVNGVRSMQYVHRLVAAAFIGPCPPGEEVRHGDGNPANNMLGNLSYSTHLVNMCDTLTHETAPVGERQWRASVTDEEAAAIRDRWSCGESITELALAYETYKPTISRIISGEAYPDATWAKLQEVCHYPGCEELVQHHSLKGAKNGRPGMYCANPDHTRTSAKIQRKRLADQQRMLARPAVACPYCTTMFVPKRSDQTYCRRACKSAAGRAKLRAS